MSSGTPLDPSSEGLGILSKFKFAKTLLSCQRVTTPWFAKQELLHSRCAGILPVLPAPGRMVEWIQ